VSGNSEQEIMPKIEQHGLEKHGLKMDDGTRNKVRNAIHKQSAKAAVASGHEQHT
jgi:predicted small metal-binding protein